MIDERGSEVRGLRDPSGGRFDAAGDFDRVLDNVPEGSLDAWRPIDPYGIVTLSTAELPALLADLAN